VAPEPAGSSPYSQEPSTGPYPEPTGSFPHPPANLPKIYSDPILSKPRSSELSLSFGLSHQNLNFAYEVYILYLSDSTSCKMLRHGTDGFTSRAKEVVLRILSSSAGLERKHLENVGSNGMHANHQTTEDDVCPSSFL
jgi:hypothetical protein